MASVNGKQSNVTESRTAQYTLIGVALLFLTLFLVLPLIAVFSKAFEKGVEAYVLAIQDPNSSAAITLTILTAAVVVPANMLFGLAAAWAIGKFHFPGKKLLVSLIDLPFSISPVVSGLIFVLLFGSQSVLGGWLTGHGVQIIFAIPGIILATSFVTFPYVARELIPLMQSQGHEEEESAISLGASGWKTFLRITLPNVKWGLLYGLILCNARAVGEFGAVSVVSGHIRGVTNTLPLHVEILYNEYQFTAAFAVASLLTIIALITLVAKSVVEWKSRSEQQPSMEGRPVHEY